MPQFLNLLAKAEGSPLIQIGTTPKAKKPVKKAKAEGCEACPQNGVKGIRKIKGLTRITGQRYMLWARNPGPNENDEGLELIGRAGKFLWSHLEEIDITRDMVDVQNVVRCWTPKRDDLGVWRDASPSKEVVKACAYYNRRALEINDGKARVHIVLGQEAAASLLKGEYKKSRPVFWSEKLEAWVVVLDHPSYFLRGAPKYRYKQWRSRLRIAKRLGHVKGRFGYVESLDYKLLTRVGQTKAYLNDLAVKCANKKYRISVDIEDGYLDDAGRPTDTAENGTNVLLAIGFSYQPGIARTIAVDHPENLSKRSHKRRIKKLLAAFLTRRDLDFSFHHGSSDCPQLLKFIGAKVRYWFDTNYSTYLAWPNFKAYGLENLSLQKLPLFSGYKDLVKGYFQKGKGFRNFAKIPLKVLALYNSADADVALRLARKTADVYQPLLRVYTSTSFVLAKMQKIGPYYDREYSKRVVQLIPQRRDKIARQLQKMSTLKRKVNLNSNGKNGDMPLVIYDKLRLPHVNEEKPYSVDKGTLELLAAKTKHPFPTKLNEYRRLNKMDTTYIKNYEASADRWGWLRTNWWLTGTITGRLSSGGKEEEAICNFQNLHGSPLLKNLLVSDPKWRKIYAWFNSSGHLREALFRRCRRLQAFLALDYSNIEVRMLAEYSQDKLLIQQFKSGINIHCIVGHELTGIDVKVIAKDDVVRRMIKALHFGIIYGMGKKTLFEALLAKGIKITRQKSDKLYDTYFMRYRGVAKWIEKMRAFAEANHYVPTLFGFNRPIVTETEEGERGSYWGNQAINSPLQGSAHQLLLIAMAILYEQAEKFEELQTPVMEVHDALVFFNPVSKLRMAFQQAVQLMQEAVPKYVEKHFDLRLQVPLIAEAKAGFRYGSMLGYDGQYSSAKFLTDWVSHDKEITAAVDKEWGVAA